MRFLDFTPIMEEGNVDFHKKRRASAELDALIQDWLKQSSKNKILKYPPGESRVDHEFLRRNWGPGLITAYKR